MSNIILTFSCAKYDSVEIGRYLRKVNKVAPSYPIQRLCTEDPISVSRKFTEIFFNCSGKETSTWRSYTIFLEKRVPIQGCSTLSLNPLDQKTKLLCGLIKELLGISQMKRSGNKVPAT